VGGLSGTGATGSGTGGTFTGEPPEEEQEEEFQAPVASGRFLWAANPASNRVALVDAESLDVASLEAGYTPTYLAALPAAGGRTAGAAVINVNGRDVTLFSLPEGDVEVDAKSVTTLTLPLFGAANAWKVSAKGAFAIAWTNAKDLTAADPTEGFQDVTVIDRRSDAPSATRLSVGYRPTQVFIDEDETFAFVVSEPGISVIDLTADGGPAVVRELFLPEQTLDAPRDVSFVPSGKYAFVRIEGEKKIHIVDTESDTRKVVALPAAATDLDVSRDGDRAVVVMRAPTAPEEPVTGASGSAGAPVVEDDEPSRVAVLTVATIVSDPATFALYEIDEFFGSAVVSKDGKRALLFTNAVAHDTLGILDLDTGSHRELDLKAPVKAAYLTSDGNNAVALLSPPEGSTKLGAFALVPVDKVLPPRIEGTDAPTFLVALSTTPARALVTTRDEVGSAHATYLASFPSLSVDRVDLPSRPLASGLVPEAGKGFVAEQHEEGRVTFVDLADGSARTLTGFELGSKVVDGE
jgi:DNA-binding beta-propeller fold protein YncE